MLVPTKIEGKRYEVMHGFGVGGGIRGKSAMYKGNIIRKGDVIQIVGCKLILIKYRFSLKMKELPEKFLLKTGLF